MTLKNKASLFSLAYLNIPILQTSWWVVSSEEHSLYIYSLSDFWRGTIIICGNPYLIFMLFKFLLFAPFVSFVLTQALDCLVSYSLLFNTFCTGIHWNIFSCQGSCALVEFEFSVFEWAFRLKALSSSLHLSLRISFIALGLRQKTRPLQRWLCRECFFHRWSFPVDVFPACLQKWTPVSFVWETVFTQDQCLSVDFQIGQNLSDLGLLP